MPNLKCIALSAYKSDTYIDIWTSKVQIHKQQTHARALAHAHRHTPSRPHTNTHLDTHKHLREGGLKKKVFREDLKELTEDA